MRLRESVLLKLSLTVLAAIIIAIVLNELLP